MSKIAVLMYHALEDERNPAGARDAGEQRYVLTVRQFEEQMAYLHGAGYRSLLPEDVAGGAPLPARSVMITFDDGHESNYTLALPILRRYGFRAQFFVTTGRIGTPFHLCAEQLVRLFDAGMGIGSHGVTHNYLPDLAPAEARSELEESKKTLEALVPTSVTTLSYPGGRSSTATDAAARACGYTCLFGSVPGYCRGISGEAPVSRLALTSDMALCHFEKLLQGRLPRGVLLRHALLAGAKAAFGNALYERVRHLLLPRLGG